jgi:hypothetical protein
VTKVEQWGLGFLAIIVFGLLIHFYNVTVLVRHLDSVFLFESISGIWETGKPISASVATWPPFVKALGLLPEDACAMPLGFYPAYNVFDNHAYTVLYPLALVAKIIGIEAVFSVANSFAYLTLLLAPYIFLRYQGLARFPAVIFSFLVLCYPGWSWAAIGDYYLDRLYMPFMLLLLYALHRQLKKPADKNYFLLIPIFLAIAAASFTERAAIMVIAVLAFFCVMFPAFRSNKKILIVAVSVIVFLVAYLFCYYRFFYHGVEGANGIVGNALLSYPQMVERVNNPKLWTFLLTNFLFLGWCVFFAGWRYALLLLGALVPNILVSIGGAELTGWTTHYHSMYIPFLIFTASIGFLKLNEYIKANALQRTFPVMVGLSALVVVYCFDPSTGAWSKGVRGSLGLTSSVFRFYLKPNASGDLAMAHWLKTLAVDIPVGAKVSSVEGAMPALYQQRRLALYPFGMDEAEYIVVSGTVVNGVPTGIVGAANDRDTPLLNECLVKRAVNQGFVLFKDLPSVGVVIFKKEVTY